MDLPLGDLGDGEKCQLEVLRILLPSVGFFAGGENAAWLFRSYEVTAALRRQVNPCIAERAWASSDLDFLDLFSSIFFWRSLDRFWRFVEDFGRLGWNFTFGGLKFDPWRIKIRPIDPSEDLNSTRGGLKFGPSTLRRIYIRPMED